MNQVSVQNQSEYRTSRTEIPPPELPVLEKMYPKTLPEGNKRVNEFHNQYERSSQPNNKFVGSEFNMEDFLLSAAAPCNPFK